MTPHLIVLDVDSTLITSEVIELIAERAGTREQVADITARAMRGELDFAQSLHERVATLAGVSEGVFADVLGEVSFTPGAEKLITTLQSQGWTAALVSGGFEEVVASLAAQLDITQFRANRLDIKDGVLTGRTVGPVIDREAKAMALREYADHLGIDLAHTVAVGDGANDLGMMAVAGVSVAFGAAPIVQEAADIALNTGRLDDLLPLLTASGVAETNT